MVVLVVVVVAGVAVLWLGSAVVVCVAVAGAARAAAVTLDILWDASEQRAVRAAGGRTRCRHWAGLAGWLA